MQDLAKFHKGDAVKLQGGTYLITNFIGSGTNGEVYKANNLEKKGVVALKYNFGQYAVDRQVYYNKVAVLCRGVSPHPAFAWPFDIGSIGDNGSFMVAMPLKEGYGSLAPVMRGESGLSMDQRLALAQAVVEPFVALHKGGFVYVDFSQTNIRYKQKPDGFHVAVIDTDSISVKGGCLGLQGTGLFRAPELLLGGSPSLYSDYHSLTALVFHLLVGCNPLDGAKTHSVPFTSENVIRYWGKEPAFIFGGNGNPCQSAEAIANWEQLPDLLRSYFFYQFSNDCLHGRCERLSSDYLMKVLQLKK